MVASRHGPPGMPDKIRPISLNSILLGVPPPMYTVSGRQGQSLATNSAAISAESAGPHTGHAFGWAWKRRLAGSKVATAEDFIRLCGSASSMSGTAYQIRFSDGRVVTSEAFLRQRLAEFVQ